MSKRFDIGKLVATAGVHELMTNDLSFRNFVNASFMRYIMGDWGDTCEEDKKLNDSSVENGERILAVYKMEGHPGNTIWIITEWDRSCTTILFPNEY